MVTSYVAECFFPDLIRYHCPIIVILHLKNPKSVSFKRNIWKYDQGDFIKYRQILDSTNWTHLLSITDLELLAVNFNKILLDAAKTSIPNKIINVRTSDVPWFHSNLRKLIRQRKRLHKKAKSLNTEITWSRFRTKRNEVTKAIKKAKVDYKKKIIENINDNTLNSKNWFKLTKSYYKIANQLLYQPL